ncbi:DUF1513 domain-containing protein [Ahrensia kielensis]|uniref:DUF1513 domain-containing protein n=1 Tax=Ahrensia kielensis TaxID=76980 RepID=A0ABU9T4Y8_9HYPH
MHKPLLIDRRSFLASAGAAFLGCMSDAQARAIQQTDAVFASAYKAPDGRYGIATLSERGELLHSYVLPERGHDTVWRADGGQLIAFARRPGTFAAVIDPSGQSAPTMIHAVEGRHFYGHGVYSPDGAFVFATENDFDNARGVIGIYNTRDNFKRVGEFDAHGIGPHDMELLPDGRTLVVANGGIETHPDFPRAKLNIASMKPNLTFLDSVSGKLIGSFELPKDQHKLSIRHMALMGDNVWFACQNEGDLVATTPLVGQVSLENGTIHMAEIPDDVGMNLRGYVGSIAANEQSNEIAFTSPRGGILVRYDTRTKKVAGIKRSDEICGVAASGKSFAWSNGEGAFNDTKHPMLWDNHISVSKSASAHKS